MGEASTRGPLPSGLARGLDPLLAVAERFYMREVARRNWRYDTGEGVTRLDRPVISVGNLSVGGVGKTPLVTRLCAWLVEAGHKPAIAMRGYGAGKGQESDEASSYRRRFADGAWPVPVVAQPDRIAGLRALFKTSEGARVDCVVLDDGFQHRKIARDLNIALIDVSRDFFSMRCLPRGWLREPPRSVQRADAVVLTHAELIGPSRLMRYRRRLGPILGMNASGSSRPVLASRHVWSGLDVQHADGLSSDEAPAWLAGKQVLAVCAIGAPRSFLQSCERATGVEEVDAVVLRDHDPYKPATVRKIIAEAERIGADAIVTTDKDWSKLSPIEASRWGRPVVRPRLTMELDDGPGGVGLSGGEVLRSMALAVAKGPMS